jgi:hypothetical protein
MATEVTRLLHLQDLLLNMDENLQLPLTWEDPDRVMLIVDEQRGRRCQMRYQSSTVDPAFRVAVFEGDQLGWTQVRADDVEAQFQVLRRWHQRGVDAYR